MTAWWEIAVLVVGLVLIPFIGVNFLEWLAYRKYW